MPFFAAPLFLWSCLAVAIPVAIHLLHRRKPRPVLFSTLRFITEAVARTRRSRNVTHAIVLAMRMLILLLLAFAFSRPTVRFATWLPEGARTVILVLDGSVSMRYRDGDLSCFDRCRTWALKLIEAMDTSDRTAVLVPGRPQPSVVFPPVSDHDAVHRQVRDLEPGFGTANLVQTLSETVSRLVDNGEKTGIEIHVFSDFQQSAWNTAEAEGLSNRLAELGFLLFLNRVTPQVAANCGIQRTAFYPPGILGDGQFSANAQIRASADFAGQNAIRLVVQDAERQKRTFSLRPAQTVSESLGASASGDARSVTGFLELETDALIEDNLFRFSLPRLPGIPILLVDGSARGEQGTRDTFFLRYAIQPRGKAKTIFLPRIVDWPTFGSRDPREFRVLFVCNPPDLPSGVAEKIMRFAQSGGTVVFMPGEHEALTEQITRLEPFSSLVLRKETFPEETSLALVSADRPADLEKRMAAIVPTPPTIIVRRRLVFTRTPEGSRSLYQYPEGAPFAIEVSVGQGSLWLMSVSANRDWSEWPLSPLFVICSQELIKSAASRNLPSLVTRVGEALALEWQEEAVEIDFRLTSPDGRTRMVAVSRTNSQQPVILRGFDTPGFYRLERNGDERMIAVNCPEEESNLNYTAVEELRLSLHSAETYFAASWHELQQQLVDLRQGRPLWPLLLSMAFLVAVTEELLSNVRSRASGLPRSLQQFLRKGGRAA